MQKPKLLSVISLILALLLIISGCSGPSSVGNGGNEKDTVDNNQPQATNQDTKQPEGVKEIDTSIPMEVTLLYSDNPSYPFQEDWIFPREAKARKNVDLKFMVVPNDDYEAKKKILLNTGEAPDIVINGNKESEFALNGVFTAISDHYDKLPNMMSRIESLGIQADIDNLCEQDGKLYLLPRINELGGYDSGIAIRLDILEEYGLDVPKNFDELYDVMKVMKEKDPSCLPLTQFWGIGQLLSFMYPSWGFTPRPGNVYYDWNTEKYESSATSPLFKEILVYLNMVYNESLMDPELFTQDLDQWTAKVTSGKSLVTFCWSDQLDSIITAGKEFDPNFDLQNIYPLTASSSTGPYIKDFSFANAGYVIPTTTTKRADFDRLMEFVDWWLYSDEGTLLTNWGVEGESHLVENEKIVFKKELLSAPNGPSKQSQMDYGLFIWQLMGFQRGDRYAEYMGPLAAKISMEMDSNGHFRSAPPAPKLSVDDTERMQLLSAPIKDAFDKATEVFVLGKMNFENDWDEYVKGIEAKGMQEIVDLNNAGIGK